MKILIHNQIRYFIPISCVWAMALLLTIFLSLSGLSSVYANEINLSGNGWKAWLDEKAQWEEDPLYLPSEIESMLSSLPVNEPTGGWEILNEAGKDVSVPMGGKLLGALAESKIFVPSACGGGGTCAQCKVKIFEGGGDILPTERTHINNREAREGERLSCQVVVKRDMKIEVPPEVFGVKKWNCTVRSNKGVATFIKELVVALPEGETIDFRAGGYIQIGSSFGKAQRPGPDYCIVPHR